MGCESNDIMEDLNNNDGIELCPNAKIPFIPGGITYKLKRALKNAGCNANITAGRKLSSILCAKNKTQPDRLDNKGVYKYVCKKCGKIYIGETARSFRIRHEEHMNPARNGRWHHSGLTQHMEKCDGEIEGPIILCTMNAKTKAKLKRDLRIREALEIQRHYCGPGQGMNEDWGSYVKTTQWGPVFSGM